MPSGSYLRRGLNWYRTAYLPAPTGGWNPDANWWELADNQSAVLENFLLRPGKLVARGPLVGIASVNAFGGTGNPAAPAGYAFGDAASGSTSPSGVFNAWWKNDDTARFIDPWNAPLLNAPSANLAQGSTTQHQASLDAANQVQAHTLASRDVVGGPRWINFNGLMYGISYDAVAGAVHDTNSVYNIPPLNLLTMPVLQTPAAANGGTWLATAGADNAAVGTVAWTNAATGITSDNHSAPAVASLAGGSDQTHYLVATFGAHAIPGGATITGVQVQFDAQAHFGGFTQMVDASIKLVKGGTPTGTDHSDARNQPIDNAWVTYAGTPPQDVHRSYGGPSDLWGTTLAPADVNAANFGVALSFKGQGTFPDGVDVAAVWLTVYYTTDTVSVPTVLSNAPHGAFDLKGYLSRVWLLGGVNTPNGTTVHEPATIYYTNPLGTPGAGTPLGTNTADWKDPVTASSNNLQMDLNNADYGVGLALVPNAMLVFRRNSVWRLTGTTSTTFVLKPMSREVGCIDARSIVETDKGVFWLSMRGLMFTDGTSIKNVSGTVGVDLTTAIGSEQSNLLQSSVNNKASGWATCALTSQGHILVSIGTIGANNNSSPPTMLPTWGGMYDPATGAWTRHTSSIFQQVAVGDAIGPIGTLPYTYVSHPGRQQLYSWGGPNGRNLLVQFENYAYQDVFKWGNTFLLTNNVQFRMEDVDKTTLANNSEYTRYIIPLVWTTKLVPFDVSHKRSLIKRWFIDFYAGSGANTSHTGGFYAKLHFIDQAAGASSFSPSTAGYTTNPPGGQQVVGGGPQLYANPQVGRVTTQYDKEVQDMWFELRVSLTEFSSHHWGINAFGLNSTLFEVYGIGVDFATTRDDEAY